MALGSSLLLLAVVALVIFIRLVAARWSNISDCDETFNYWEPMHFMLFGTGFQTWEYSPVYGLRSYAYLEIHAAVVRSLSFLGDFSKIELFYAVRVFLALFAGVAELKLFSVLRSKQASLSLGSSVPILFILFSALSCGMFISTAAFLPSSFALVCTTLALAYWIESNYFLAILFTAISGIVGWPFAAALGAPIALNMIFGNKFFSFIGGCLVSLAVVLVPLVAIDSAYYGKLVIAPLNIVLYNVLSSETSSELYGTEPWTFYFLNGAINFNVVFPLALMAPILLSLKALLVKNKQVVLKGVAITSGMWVWLAIFVPQPHKEERFLFPIYTLICLSAAISLDILGEAIAKLAPKSLKQVGNAFKVMVIVLFAAICASRIAALHQHYHAPLNVYEHLASNINTNQETNVVCVGKEWYRFPSSFFLPKQTTLEFIRSEFRGQLPQHFDVENGTSGIPPHMNAMNEEEPSRYVDISSCDYLVDVELHHTTSLEPNYGAMEEWEQIYCEKFLDVAATPSALVRAVVLPGPYGQQLMERKTMGNYCLYKHI